MARRMAVWGTVAAVAGYGSAWLAAHVFGARERLLEAIAVHHPEAMAAADPVREVLGGQYGAVPSTSWDWLLVADPYSQTPAGDPRQRGRGVRPHRPVRARRAAPGRRPSCCGRSRCSGRWR